MNKTTEETRTAPGAVIIPTLRYRDASRAIRFICAAFGFKEAMVVKGEGDSIDHAQLTWNAGMLMLSSMRDDEYGKLLQGGRANTGPAGMGLYIIVEDAVAHCERARRAGAEIVMEPEEQNYGGRLYTCRDPEGVVWSFGEYDPWRDPARN